MRFTLFDLNALLINKRNIKFTSFSSKSLEILTQANDCLEKMPYCLGLSGQRVIQYKKNLLSALKNNNTAAFKKALAEFKADYSHIKQVDQNIKIKNHLSILLSQLAKKSPELNNLQHLWQKNIATHHLTSEAIYLMGNLIIPLFENFHTLASQELTTNKKKVLPGENSQLRIYLSNLKNEIQKIKAQLCDAMILRLQVAHQEHNLTCDDIVYSVIKKLAPHITIDYQHTKEANLTEALFLYFHYYLLCNGSASQQQKLQRCTWLTEDNKFILIKTRHTYLIVPKPMSDFVKKSNSYFNYLFDWWQQYYFAFFKNKFYLLADLRTILSDNSFVNLSLKNLLDPKHIMRFEKLEDLLWAENITAHSYISSIINKILLPFRIEFYRKWQSFIIDSLKSLLEQKMLYVAKIATQLKTRLIFDLHEPDIDPILTKTILCQLIANIEENRTKLNMQPDNNWQTIKSILTAFIERERPSLTTTKVVDKLISPNTNNLQHNKIQNEFNGLLNNDVIDYHNPEFQYRLNRFNNALTQESSNNNDKLWLSFFTAYLRTCIQKNCDVTAYEKIDALFYQAPALVKDRLQLLKQDRAHSFFRHKMRCQALLFSLETSNNTQTISSVYNSLEGKKT